MQMYIGGKKVDASDGATIEVINPATLQLIDTVPSATKQDVDKLLDFAVNGFREWSQTPLFKRIEILKTFLEKYQANSDELVDLLVAEVGKPIKQAIGCVTGTKDIIEEYIERARSIGGETLPPSNRMDVAKNLSITVREPLGVVAGLLPFNYPIDQISHKVLPALLMGNSIVIKPSSETPLANIRFVELMLESGVPGNVIQIVTGNGLKVGKWMIDDPRVNAVTMTGSTETGKIVAKNSSPHLHHILLELGGNSPDIVLEDADLNLAVEEAVAGRTLNSGQVCSANKRFIVHNSIKQEYTQKLIALLKTKKVGDPTESDTDCGPVVSLKAAQEIERQIQHTILQGGKVLLGGNRFRDTYIELTVIETDKDSDVAKDMEIFGPVWPIIGFDTVDEAIKIANNTKYGLSSGVFGRNIADLMKIAKSIEAGDCIINGGACYRAVDMPFGGHKESGLGREGSIYSLHEMSQVKTIVFKNMY